MNYHIGQIVKGTVTGIQPYGAFVSMDEQTQGLVHVSEIQSGFTKNINEVLKVDQKVKVQIIDIDEYSQKISLSIRSLEEHVKAPNFRRKRFFTNRNKKIGFHSIEIHLEQWITDALSYLRNLEKEK